jgi:hypothetical protein
MSSIIENKARIGNFTNSQIYKLMTIGKGPGGIGAPALTYINEKKIERRLGRSISVNAYTRDMAWGHFMEYIVFDKIEFGYELSSSDTLHHPTIECWKGSCDFTMAGVKIAELKCYQPKNFSLYTDALMIGDIDNLKSNFPEEYWQAVGNAIVNQVDKAELITFMPYKSELDNIRSMAENYDGDNQWHYRFIYESDDSSLAYLPDNGYYKNINCFEFIVPEEDKKVLTDRVNYCHTLLK